MIAFSPDDSVIFMQGTVAGTIIDNVGNDWTISQGQVTKNGFADPTTANVVELAYVDGEIWQENTAGLWWVQEIGGDWSSPDGEYGTSGNPLSGTLPNIIAGVSDADGVVDIGTLTASGSSPYVPAALIKVPAGVSDLITAGVTLTSYTMMLELSSLSGGTLVINGKSTVSQNASLDLMPLEAFDLPGPTLVNNGTMIVSGYATGVAAGVLTGRGVVTVTDSATVNFGAANAGETIQLKDGFLYIGDLYSPLMPGLSFFAPVTDFGQNSAIFLRQQATSEMFTKTGYNSGILQLFDGGKNVADLSISGAPIVYAIAANPGMVIISTHDYEDPLTILGETPKPTYDLTVVDTTTGDQIDPQVARYSGPVTELQEQFVTSTNDNINITAESANWYLRTGGGMDALTVTSGINVLDGGGGSVFMTGGSGYDDFFIDTNKIATNPWSTIVNFHSGDNVTFWGVTPDDFKVSLLDEKGAPGYTGVTLVVTQADGSSAAVTLTGVQLEAFHSGAVRMSFGVTSNLPDLPGGAYMQVSSS